MIINVNSKSKNIFKIQILRRFSFPHCVFKVYTYEIMSNVQNQIVQTILKKVNDSQKIQSKESFCFFTNFWFEGEI